jgi:hypothetical protein
VCEPRLLRAEVFARRALALVDRVTRDLLLVPAADRRTSSVRTLRQALGYGWSVVVAALPDVGLPMFRDLATIDDPDIAWIVRENRKKARLQRLVDPPHAP